MASACAARTEQRIDAQEAYDESFERNKKEYVLLKDWNDIADQASDMVPMLLALVELGQLATAQFHVQQMIAKAADNHADVCATNATEPSTW